MYIPPGFNTVTPYFIVENAESFVRFLIHGLGGVEKLRSLRPDDATYPCKGVYREIVAPERIVYAGEAVDGHACGGGLPPRSLVTVSFVEHDGRTTLTLHTRFGSAASLDAAVDAGYSSSWAVTLERLAEALSNLR
jgi:uncharacterized protein YndB with AHSA1/START domain